MVKVFYDTETTGTDHRRNSIHELAYIIEVDGEVVISKCLHMRPHKNAIIVPKALRVGNVTEDQIKSYPPFKDAKNEFLKDVCKYIDRFDNKDKAYLIGFKNAGFDDFFLRTLLLLCNDSYFDAIFYASTIDVSCLAAEYLAERQKTMINFKLKRVAEALGIPILDEKLHTGLYDAQLTRKVYKIVTGREVESIYNF